jgi:hypothetical protein
MLELAGQFAERHACSRIDSHVDADAVGFYTRCGFDRVDGGDQQSKAVLMTKPLR